MPMTPSVPGPLAVQALAEALRLEGRARPPTMGKRGVSLLAQVPLFAGLSKRHLRRIADLAEEVRFGEGRTIVQRGTPGKAFYVIAEGRAKVFPGVVPTGRALARLGPGDFFGEMALLDGRPRTASVVAQTPLAAIRLSRGAFREMLRAEPEVALKILEELARRLRERQRSVTE